MSGMPEAPDTLYSFGETTVPEEYGVGAGLRAFRWRLLQPTEHASAGFDLYFCPQAVKENEWPGPFMAIAPDCAHAFPVSQDEVVHLMG